MANTTHAHNHINHSKVRPNWSEYESIYVYNEYQTSEITFQTVNQCHSADATNHQHFTALKLNCTVFLL